MRPDEIREMGAEDITARVNELQEERFRLKFRSATEPLEEPLRLRVIRKDIARLKTILTEREKGIVREAAGTASATAKKGKTKKSTARRPAKKGAAKTKAR